MKALRNAILVAVILTVTLSGSAFGGGPLETINIKEPLDMYAWVPCADGGNGEYVHLTGQLHVLLQATVDNTGGLHVKWHAQPMGVSGVGLTTGDTYRGTGVTQDHTTSKWTGFPYIYTYVNNFRIIGQGPGNNYLVHQTFRITVNANGEVTSEVDNFRVECK